LGIDLNADEVTPNDDLDADTGANNQQNFPVLSGVTVDGATVRGQYVVPSTVDNSAYPLRIEFFLADADGKEGQTFLGFDTYTAADASASKTFAFTSVAAVAVGQKLVATATDNNGNTSEFSASATLQAPACSTVVVNTDDSGTGSLREAITCANNTTGIDIVSFNIPGNGVKTILPATALPTITDPVTIDGYTQPGAMQNSSSTSFNGTLLIELDGTFAGPTVNGLTITAGNTSVNGLVINRFAGNGVLLQTGGGNSIAGNLIGTNSSATTRLGNGSTGVRIVDSAYNVIGGLSSSLRNVISGNFDSGIYIVGASARINLVAGNFIGLAASGAAALPNTPDGVVLQAPLTTIGGSVPGAGNVISGNSRAGLVLFSGANYTVVAGNFIGTNATGTASLGNAAEGVGIHADASNNTIGGNSIETTNVISGNALDGVVMFTGAATNRVAGNFIGTDLSHTLSLPNGRDGVLLIDAANNTIDGNNTIASNGGPGIVVLGASAQGNSIQSNSIYSNNGLGIDLGGVSVTGGDGATPNDSGDADTGPNNLQNFPVISYATRDAGKLKVTYSDPSDPANSTYPMRVEFFLADASGQGKTYLGFDTFLDTDYAAGGKTVTLTTTSPIKVSDHIVATATDSLTAADGGGPANTSEFSPSVTIVSPWQNKNPGRLRWDVTDDKSVSADDVVGIINYINAKGSGLLPDGAKNEKPYIDVDGDNNVVAADVIDVINYINAGRQLGGEAEATQDTSAGEWSPAPVDAMALLAADVAAQAVRKRK
jgi:hypothetical protein